MNLFKKILMVVVALISLPFIVALFVKKEYTVERQVVIDRPEEEVFDYIRYLKNQDSYNEWIITDPEMKKAFKGTDGQAGFVYVWDGEKAGKGEQKLENVQEGERIDMALRFIKPFEGTASAWMITSASAADKTLVTWGMKGVSTYPMNFMNLFMDQMLGKDLHESLSRLKRRLEK